MPPDNLWIMGKSAGVTKICMTKTSRPPGGPARLGSNLQGAGSGLRLEEVAGRPQSFRNLGVEGRGQEEPGL